MPERTDLRNLTDQAQIFLSLQATTCSQNKSERSMNSLLFGPWDAAKFCQRQVRVATDSISRVHLSISIVK